MAVKNASLAMFNLVIFVNHVFSVILLEIERFIICNICFTDVRSVKFIVFVIGIHFGICYVYSVCVIAV